MAKSQQKVESQNTHEGKEELMETLQGLMTQQAETSRQLAIVAQRLAENTDINIQRQKNDTKTKRKQLGLVTRIGQVERELLEGDTFFHVSLDDEPMMTRFVGIRSTGNPVNDEVVAIEKYRKYFGVVSFKTSEGRHRYGPTVEKVSSLPSLEDVSAWPVRQRKHLVDARDAEQQLASLAG